MLTSEIQLIAERQNEIKRCMQSKPPIQLCTKVSVKIRRFILSQITSRCSTFVHSCSKFYWLKVRSTTIRDKPILTRSMRQINAVSGQQRSEKDCCETSSWDEIRVSSPEISGSRNLGIPADLKRALESGLHFCNPEIHIGIGIDSRREANLLSAEATLEFMLQKLQEQNSQISKKLASCLLKRINERRTDLSGTLLYLHNVDKFYEKSKKALNNDIILNVPAKSVIRKNILHLIKRLEESNCKEKCLETTTKIIERNENCQNVSQNTINNSDKKSMSQELQQKILALDQPCSSSYSSSTTSLSNIINKEVDLYENGGKRGVYLEKVYKYLLSIAPTSVEPERSFSSAGYLCNKIRSNMSFTTLDTLSFLRAYFQQK